MQLLARAALCLFVASPFAAATAAGCSGNEQTGSTNNLSESTSTSTGTASSTASTASGGTGGATGGTGTAGAGSSVGGAGTASTTTSTSTGTSTGTSTSGAGGAGGSLPILPAECQGHVYLCGDTIDNDGDGLVDSQDPDCLGPCDNTEDSFYGGIPGQGGPGCTQDCYFDQDSGAGNDDCYWNHKCDEHEMAPNWYPESNNGMMCAYDPTSSTPGTGASCDELYMTQSQKCYDYCGPLTPNGCDCFGCCELPGNPGNYVWLGSEDASGNGKCTLANLADPNFCEPCKPVQACLNTCDICEVCVGKPTLPPECFPDGGTPTGSGGSTSTGSGGDSGPPPMQCPPNVQPCGQFGQLPCPMYYYCITGCCQPVPP